MIDFAFSPEQVEFRDTLHKGLAEDSDAWFALGVPDVLGDLGLDEVWLVGLLEEAGYYALPDPWALSAALGLGPLVTLGGIDPGPTPTTTATSSGGRTPRVPGTDRATRFLLADPNLAVFDVVPDEIIATGGLRTLADVRWSGGTPSSFDATQLLARATLAASAELCGLGSRMLELGVEYARERKQFGVAIGSFQAVKHHLATARVRLEFARPMLYRAAHSMATGDATAARHLSMAKALASDAGELCARASLQVHGAIGYTEECALFDPLRRTLALCAAYGDAAWHRTRVIPR